jgi:hypothetical protein
MAKRVELSKDRDIGQVMSDSFLFLKQQFSPYMNCLFILSAPCFIISKISSTYYTQHFLNQSIDLFSIPALTLSLSQIIFNIGIWLIINISVAYVVCYAKGTRKAKPVDILRLIRHHMKKWWLINSLILLLWLIIWFVSGFTLTQLSLLWLGIVLIIALPLFSYMFYRIDGLLILGLRENENLVNDHKKVGETMNGNRLILLLSVAVGLGLAWLLHTYNYLPFILIESIGQYTELYNWQEWMDNHATLAIVINVIYSIFILYLSSFALLILHLLFFTLEEKLKGNSLIHKIETIGKDS